MSDSTEARAIADRLVSRRLPSDEDLSTLLNQAAEMLYDWPAAPPVLVEPSPLALTREDIDQIVEGIEHFIIEGYKDLIPVWQPYIDKLAALRETLTTIG